MDPARAQVPRHACPQADLLTTIARLLARRQLHNAPSLHTGWTIQQLATDEYRILEVLNYELTTPTPTAWIEVLERRLSLGQELQLPAAISPAHPACATRRACTQCASHCRGLHSGPSLYSELQTLSSSWSVCLVRLRRPLGLFGTDCSLLRFTASLVVRHSTPFVTFRHCARDSHWMCACHFLIFWMFHFACAHSSFFMLARVSRLSLSYCLQKNRRCLASTRASTSKKQRPQWRLFIQLLPLTVSEIATLADPPFS